VHKSDRIIPDPVDSHRTILMHFADPDKYACGAICFSLIMSKRCAHIIQNEGAQNMADVTRDPNCLFCKIIAGEIPATPLIETDEAVVIPDINPQAPTHALAIPRRHIPSVASLTADDAATLAAVIAAANAVAHERGLDTSGYRLVINHGPDAGQSVPHLHIHILGGKPLGWPPFPSDS
jgi:histidine triad (HIT) family protein